MTVLNFLKCIDSNSVKWNCVLSVSNVWGALIKCVKEKKTRKIDQF